MGGGSFGDIYLGVGANGEKVRNRSCVLSTPFCGTLFTGQLLGTRIVITDVIMALLSFRTFHVVERRKFRCMYLTHESVLLQKHS